MSLSNVKHQSRAQAMLQRAYSGNRLSHAYIFHGPDGVGKETLARGLAQLLLCDSPIEGTSDTADQSETDTSTSHAGCGTCESCRLVLAETHPDVHSIYRQLARQHPDSEVRRKTARQIVIAVIRDFVISKVGLTSVRGRAKVFLIREADLLVAPAQHAILKTLEEPSEATYLILLTAHLDRLLPTIQSRCQLVEFGVLPTVFVSEKLQERHPELPREDLEWYARSAGGSIGDAEQAVQHDRIRLASRVIETLATLCDTNCTATLKEWIAAAESAASPFRKEDPELSDAESKRKGLKIVFRIASDYFADALRIRTGQGDTIISQAHRRALASVAEDLHNTELIDRINRIARAGRQLDRNVHIQLCTETLLCDLACGVPASSV